MATLSKKWCTGLGSPKMLGNMKDILYDAIFDMRI